MQNKNSSDLLEPEKSKRVRIRNECGEKCCSEKKDQ